MATTTTTPVKNNGQVPYLDPSNPNQPQPLTNQATNPAPAPLATPAPVTGATPATTQGNTNVLNTAQNMVTSSANTQSPLSGLITQKTTDLLNNPNGNFNGEAYKQNQLQNFDVNNAKNFEALRQKNADIAGSGIFQNATLQNQLQSLRDRGNLTQQIDTQNYQTEHLNALDALASARATDTNNQNSTNSAIDNMVKVIGANEGNASRSYDASKTAVQNAQQLLVQYNDIAGQQTLAELQGKIQSGQQLQAQDFQASQAAIDNALKIAMQNNDIQAQQNLTTLKGQIDAAAQQAQQAFEAQSQKNQFAHEEQMQYLSTDSQKQLMQLQGDIDTGKMLKQQDFQAAQAQIDRDLQTALNNGDHAAILQLEQVRGQIQIAAQQAQQQWQTGERVATEGWQTSERMETQNATIANKYLDAQLAQNQTNLEFSNSLTLQGNQFEQQKTLANLQAQIDEAKASNDFGRTEILTRLQSSLQAGLQEDAQAAAKELQQMDINAQQVLQTQKDALALKMQTNDMDQQTRMAFLTSQLEEAKANNDVGRQESILTFQHAQEMDTLERTQGFQAAMQYSQQQADMAIKQGDWLNAQVLQQQQIAYQAKKDAVDQTIEQARVALEGKQVDLQGQQLTFDQIEKGVEAGQIDPQAATDAIAAAAKQYGITVQAADPQATQKAALQQYQDMQYQFSLSHPEYVQKDAAGNFVALTPQGISAFNTYVNKTTATQSNPASVTADIIQNPADYLDAATGGEKQAEYNALLSKASTFASPQSKLDAGTYKFQEATPTINIYRRLNVK
jgi:hypothetical protein